MQGKRHDRVVEMRLCFFSGKVGDYKVPFKSTRKCRSTIEQLQNRQKILLNRKTDTERRVRTHRLIEQGAILESIFPATVTMTGEEAKAFLLALSRLPGAEKAAANVRKSGDVS